jgi:hypothetical protein
MPKKRVTKRKKATETYVAPELQPLTTTPEENPMQSRLVGGLVLAALLVFVVSRMWKQGGSAAAPPNPGSAQDFGPMVKLKSVGKFKLGTPPYALKADSDGDLFALTANGISSYLPSGAASESIKLDMKAVWRNMAFDGKHFFITGGDNTVRVVPKSLKHLENQFKVKGAKDLFGIAVSPEGKLYITDRVLHCVFIVSQSGQVLGKFGGAHGDDNFVYPVDAVFDKAGSFYTSDFLSARIIHFGPDGKSVASWSAPWSNHDWERIGVLGDKVYIDGYNDHRFFIEDLSGHPVGQSVELDDGTPIGSPQMVGIGLDGFLYVYSGDSGYVYKIQP